MTDKQEAKAWREMAIRLSSCLNRFTLDCEELHHAHSEYHRMDEKCPVIKEIIKTNVDFDNLLENARSMPRPQDGDESPEN